MNRELTQLLLSLGITANYTGFDYTLYAVLLAAEDPARLVQVTKNLYPTVASRFHSTAGRVEQNIRHAAELAWKTNPRMLQDIAGYPLIRRPRASQFIAILTAEYNKLLAREDPDGQQRLF